MENIVVKFKDSEKYENSFIIDGKGAFSFLTDKDSTPAVQISMNTKTSVVITLYAGKHVTSLDVKLPEEKFSSVDKNVMSFWDGERHMKSYFKVTKKQGIDALKEHIANVIRYGISRKGIVLEGNEIIVEFRVKGAAKNLLGL